MPRTDLTIELSDGRTLGYAEWGEPHAFPVFGFHGTPACRLFHYGEHAPLEAGVRLIHPDRPGYGLSDYQPGRMVLDWPRDVAELADVLGLERFALFGVSGGGPHAAACAYALADRVTAVGLVSAIGPFWDVPELDALATENTIAWARDLIDRTRRDRAAAEAYILAQCEEELEMIARDPGEWSNYWSDLMAEPDRALEADPAIRAILHQSLREAVRPGPLGYARDTMLLVAEPWGFGAEEIAVPVHVWHGELDAMVPLAVAEYLARVIPDATAHIFPREAHFLVFPHAVEILRTLGESR